MKKVLIIGATSAIAHETARNFARAGAALFLVGRDTEKLTAVRGDLGVQGAPLVDTYTLDLTELDKHQELVDTALARLGGLDAVLIAHGTLSDQKSCEQNVAETIRELTTNFTSVISLLTILAHYFEQQGKGTIAVITSVAGDRGRPSNYVYGTAKGAVGIFLQGLRARLDSSGVAVMTIKPGFVDTPMTAHMKKNPLFASPRSVGRSIYQAMMKGKDVTYIPWFWRPIMALVRSVPEVVFKRLGQTSNTSPNRSESTVTK
jgi:decaprenylphospho-beta-D-erythro-pentofuranosid-2-ulose 2-reductase